MRIHQSSAPPTNVRLEIFFDGKSLLALEGETISATLHAHGISALRNTRNNHPRGIYCGMGACFDCVVTVDGRQGVRACMEKVQAGQQVRSGIPQGSAIDPLKPLCSTPTNLQPQSLEVDVLVVGAGPAGLSASVAAARSGASVVVLDERPQSGGQYFKPLAPSHKSEQPIDAQFAEGIDLTRSALALGVQILQEATVWGADTAHEVIAMINGVELIYKPAKLILATGAYERPVPFINWTLPGVMTTGAAQTLVRAYKVAPGKRIVIAGNGPLNLQLAVELVRAGVKVVAILESSRRPHAGQWRTLLKAWRFSPELMLQGLRYLAELRLHGVKVIWSNSVIQTNGKERLSEIVYAPISSSGQVALEKTCTVEADTLCLGYGFIPSTELARALGCEHIFTDHHLGYLQTKTSLNGHTSVAHVFAIGDGSSLGGARVAQARGTLAGLTAASELGKSVDVRVLTKTSNKLEQALKFQHALWDIFKAPPVMVQGLANETIACRCEEISMGQLRDAIDQGFDSLGSLKRMTRLGMGRCQGRYCACTAAKLLYETTGRVREPEQLFAPRLPVKPVPAACMAFEKPEWGGHKRSITPNLARPTDTEVLPLQKADVVVIGSGVMGACLAYYLAQEGCDVLVLERDEANLQASGANAGSLHVQLLSFDFGAKAEAGGGPAAQTLPLGPASIELWRQLEQASGEDFEITTTGGLMVADSLSGMTFLKSKAALERTFGIENEIIDGAELQALAPALSKEMLGAEYAPQEGKINPLKATYGVLKAANSLGARFQKGTSVLRIDKTGNSWCISTSRGEIQSGIIINAAGPWSREVASMVNIDLPVHSAPLQMIVTETAPILVKQLVAHADRHLSLKQATTGGLIIGGAWTAAYDDKRRFNTTLRQSVEGNLWVAQHVLPQMQGLRVLRTWAAMNINIDGAPILGEAPNVKGFYNAVTSNGYTLSPVVARMTADILKGRSTLFDPSPFSINRF